MVTLNVLLLLLAGSLGSLAQKDLTGKVFVFTEASNTTHVTVKTNATQHSLTSFTVCLRFYTELTRQCGLFSYASMTRFNDILIFKSTSNTYYVYVGDESVTFRVPEKPIPSWAHVCVTWESATGLVGFWYDGQALPRKSLKKGYTLCSETSIVLGQDQDNFGGGFQTIESFVGEMQDVYMFDRVLDPSEVALVQQNRILPPYEIDWRAFWYDLRGNVIIDKSTFLAF